MTDLSSPIRRLLSAAAVRERAHEMLERALAGEVEGWVVDLGRLADAAELTAEVTRERYPDLAIPFHARWRHFVAGEPRLPDGADPGSRARSAFDLVILSVLLDAGSGPGWQYRDPATFTLLGRSEGLAVASQRMFEAGTFAAEGRDRLRADAAVLAGLDEAVLALGFQAGEDNVLLGLDGRTALLRRLVDRAENGRLPAPVILETLLEALGPIWADRLTVDGLALGDCWRHPAIRRDDPSDGLVPLHKLSQWLAYSLIEPLQKAGLEIVDMDGLTGLAEYRNGGLFVDTAVLRLADPSAAERSHLASDPIIVAWRAMTVALLDRLAPEVRTRLGVGEAEFPLARMLEGGTWMAGRRIAAELRHGGGPPFTIISDGTIF